MDQSTIIRFQDPVHSDAPVRLDIDGLVHKGLCAFMFDPLTRIGSTDAMKAMAPAAVFAREVELARSVLQQRAFAKLGKALDIAAVPGLVEHW